MAQLAGKVAVGGFAVLGAGTVIANTYKLWLAQPTPVDMERMQSGLKAGAKVTAALEARLGPPLKSLVLENSIEGDNDEGNSLRIAKVLVSGATGKLGVLTSSVFLLQCSLFELIAVTATAAPLPPALPPQRALLALPQTLARQRISMMIGAPSTE